MTVPFGDCLLDFVGVGGFMTVGHEICEELFCTTMKNPHQDFSYYGVDIIMNGSASHHELRKLSKRIHLMMTATEKVNLLNYSP